MLTPGRSVEALVRKVQYAVGELATTLGYEQRPAMCNQAKAYPSGLYVDFAHLELNRAKAGEITVPARGASAVTPTVQPGKHFKDGSDCPQMFAVLESSFQMGSSTAEQARANAERDDVKMTFREARWLA